VVVQHVCRSTFAGDAAAATPQDNGSQLHKLAEGRNCTLQLIKCLFIHFYVDLKLNFVDFKCSECLSISGPCVVLIFTAFQRHAVSIYYEICNNLVF
jgi:hypothetical protein